MRFEVAKVLDNDLEAPCAVRYEALQVAAFAVTLHWNAHFFVFGVAADNTGSKITAYLSSFHVTSPRCTETMMQSMLENRSCSLSLKTIVWVSPSGDLVRARIPLTASLLYLSWKLVAC